MAIQRREAAFNGGESGWFTDVILNQFLKDHSTFCGSLIPSPNLIQNLKLIFEVSHAVAPIYPSIFISLYYTKLLYSLTVPYLSTINFHPHAPIYAILHTEMSSNPSVVQFHYPSRPAANFLFYEGGLRKPFPTTHHLHIISLRRDEHQLALEI